MHSQPSTARTRPIPETLSPFILVLDINHPKPLTMMYEKAEEMVDFPEITFVEQYDITDLEGSTLPVYLYRIEP
jgi:hypothetical protein